jgi:hypothetical protein
VLGDFRPLQVDGGSLVSNTRRPVFHQKNNNAKQILKNEGQEITLKERFLKWENMKIQENKA